MRIALHTGKGGVGKTTISAATAIACAAASVWVRPTAARGPCCVSTDPAHSVADVLGVPVAADPSPVSGFPQLWVAQIDTRGRFEADTGRRSAATWSACWPPAAWPRCRPRS